jgi:virginiamycin B lyase
MAKRTYLSAISAALVAALLAGCGGGGGSTPPTTTTPQSGNGNVSMTFTVPARTQSDVVKGGKKPNYVSYSTRGLEISWERYTGASDSFGHTQVCIGNPTNASCGSLSPNFVTSISPGLVSTNITCGNQASAGASYSCTIVMPAPAGYDDFQLSLWDQTPASNGTNGFGGAFSVYSASNTSGANMLSYALVKDQQVLSANSNTFNITLHPVIHTMYIALAPNTLVVGAAAPGTTINPTAPGMTFYGIDADGNTIHAASSAETYVDLNGNAVALKVTPNPVLPGSPVGNTATLHLNQPSSSGTNDCLALSANGGLTNPTQSACVVTYDGGDIVSVGYTGAAFTGCPATCSSDAANVSVTGTNLGFTRSTDGPILVPTEPTLNPLTVASGSYYGVVARDSNAYVSNHSNGTILEYNTSGLQNTYGGPVANAPQGPYGITQGPDNQIWFADALGSSIGALNLQSGAFMTPIPTSGWPNAIVTGPDNNMYFTEAGGNRVGEIQIVAGTQFTAPSYHLSESNPTLGTPNQIANGSDGYLWFTDSTSNDIGSIKPGSITTVNVCSTLQKLNPPGVPVATTLNAPAGITTGSDNALYVAETGTNTIDKIVLPGNGGCGIITATFTLAHNGAQLTTGADGNVYGIESDGNTIARISPAGQLTEFPYASGPAITNLFSGSDGKIWGTSGSTTSLYYFAP